MLSRNLSKKMRKKISKISKGFLTQTYPLNRYVVATYLNPLLRKGHLKEDLTNRVDMPYLFELVNGQLDSFASEIKEVDVLVDTTDEWNDPLDWDDYLLRKIEIAKKKVLEIVSSEKDSNLIKIKRINRVVRSFYEKGSKSLFLIKNAGAQLKEIADYKEEEQC